MMYRYHHVAFAVPDLEPAMSEVGGGMGIEWRPIQRIETTVRDSRGETVPLRSRVTYSTGPMPALELFETAPGTPLAAPEGLPFHHLGVWVDDLAGESARLATGGWEFFAAPGGEDRQLMFKSPMGIVLELCDTNVDRPWLCDLFPTDSPNFSPTPLVPGRGDERTALNDHRDRH